MERNGRGGAMNLSVSQAIATVKKFLAEEGFENVKVTSAVAIEGEAQWKVTAEIGQPARDKKEIIVNDRDGQIISYKTG
jgi:stage V sporulation protein SpoVS